MTGREAGREERTVRRTSAITHGGSPLVPSPIQGTEWRPERRAAQTGFQGRPRVVVGGVIEREFAIGALLEAVAQPPESVGALPRTAPAAPRTSWGSADDRALPAPPGIAKHLTDAS